MLFSSYFYFIFCLLRIHTGKQHITYISDSNIDSLDDVQISKVKDEVISILTYGELLCDLYFQLKTSRKPLEGRYSWIKYFLN